MAKRRRRWFLREWRKHRSLSQEVLGEKINLTQGMISHLETGATDYTGQHLEDLSKALDCTIFELLFVDPQLGEHPLVIYETLPDREKRQAIEILKTLKRTVS